MMTIAIYRRVAIKKIRLTLDFSMSFDHERTNMVFEMTKFYFFSHLLSRTRKWCERNVCALGSNPGHLSKHGKQ